MARRRDFDLNEAIIVVGSGIAGLLLAIELATAGRLVQLVTKGSLSDSNTAWAQGGLAAVTELNAADSIDQHLTDTINSGDGLTNIEAAARIVGGGGQLVLRLAQLGVEFDQTSLALEGGHGLARV
ncbi:MAG: FAD-binding protein, partial [Candidatus Obscuribacterales bacterium]|nr:FAD-binding protein [Candidatus Obscuribacterales bacterium]